MQLFIYVRFLLVDRNVTYYYDFNSRAKFAHGVLSGKYSATPEKESQETAEHQADQVHLYLLCNVDQKLISPYNINVL